MTRAVAPRSTSARASLRGPLVYVALCFALSWIPLLVLRPWWEAGGPVITRLLAASLLYAVTMGWQPIFAAAFVRAFVDPSEVEGDGVRAARFTHLAFACAAPLALVVVAAAVALSAAGLFHVDLTAAPVVAEPELAGAAPSPLLAARLVLAFALTLALLGAQALGEEVGWRGYFMTRLILRFGASAGVLWHGWVWGAWYAPIFLVTNPELARGGVRGAAFVLTCALLGTLFGWLRVWSKSILPPAAANTVLTVAAGLPFVLANADAGLRSAVYLPVGWAALLPLVVIVAWRTPARAELR